MQRDEYWIVRIRMFPGDRVRKHVVYVYCANNIDIGFMLVGDEGVYWRSQVELFEPVKLINLEG